jgi:hypothetical protein
MPRRLQIRGPPVEPVNAAARAVGVACQRKPGSLDGYPTRAARSQRFDGFHVVRTDALISVVASPRRPPFAAAALSVAERGRSPRRFRLKAEATKGSE